MTGLDGLFLHLETEATPMHVAALHVFEPPPAASADFHAAVRRMMGERIDLAPMLRRKLAALPWQFANPVWVEDEDFDLDLHVRSVLLPCPGTRAQLEDCIGELHARPLDRERPLWMLYVIHGLEDGQAAFYMKIHHAMLDGAAGVALTHALFDTEAEPAPRALPRPRRREAAPGVFALMSAALTRDADQYMKLARHLPDVVRVLTGLMGRTGGDAPQGEGALRRNFAFGPKTPLSITIDSERRIALVDFPLDAVKRIASEHGTKLNDVVLALCSGALRRYFAHHGGIPDKPLIAAMPISLREAGNTEFSTQVTMNLVSLATDIAHPLRRLHAIRDAATASKALTRHAKSVLPTDAPSIGVPWLLGGLASLYGLAGVADRVPPIANLIISNVPGPAQPLYACGARMTEYWPLSIVEHGLGVNITVMSYAGTLGFGIVSAHSAMPDPDALADGLRESFAELVLCDAPAARPKRTRSHAATQAAAEGDETRPRRSATPVAKARGDTPAAAVPRRSRSKAG
nr:wax ester/triacylglycerol synthase family O-acyltransferase [Niveibacterium umoris]